MTMFWSFRAMGICDDERGTNLLDTGAHFYDVYESSDGKYVSIGSIEPQFYAELLRAHRPRGRRRVRRTRWTASQWPRLKERLAELFKTKTRDEWCELMEGTDVCFAPVLSMDEAAEHPHNVEPRHLRRASTASRSRRRRRASAAPTAEVERPPAHAGQHTDEVLADWGVAG